jgi:hypothetical protein
MSELGEEITRKGLVAAETFRLGDEAKQPLRIARRESTHGYQRYDE